MTKNKQWENDVIEFLTNNKNELIKFDHASEVLAYRTLDFGKEIHKVSYSKLDEVMKQHFYV